ncbi:MAG TPA: phosphatidate cytidylyltransferase [Myxococcaceae bacterium]|nr:phosphatidate cytidylyltransferase [Myxococcaceae bacterium]
MNDKNRNLLLRVLSSMVLLPTVLALVWGGGFWTAGLLATATAICASEYYQITLGKLTPAGWVGIIGSGMMPLFPVWAAGGQHRAPEHAGDISFWWAAFFFFFFWAYHLIRGPLADAPRIVAHLFTGFLYGGFGMTALSELRMRPDGVKWIVVAMIITWANDTMAYFAGRFLGKHKLYPEVSPNKTWEGFAGGVVGAVGGLFIYKHLFGGDLTPVDCVLVGLAGSVLGPLGDLCESMIKRAHGVKDSGKIIPGHGGLLDRIDALLFNSPMVFLYVHFVRGMLGT